MSLEDNAIRYSLAGKRALITCLYPDGEGVARQLQGEIINVFIKNDGQIDIILRTKK